MSSIPLPCAQDDRSRLLGELLVGDPQWCADFFEKFGRAYMRDVNMLARIERALALLREERRARQRGGKAPPAARGRGNCAQGGGQAALLQLEHRPAVGVTEQEV